MSAKGFIDRAVGRVPLTDEAKAEIEGARAAYEIAQVSDEKLRRKAKDILDEALPNTGKDRLLYGSVQVDPDSKPIMVYLSDTPGKGIFSDERVQVNDGEVHVAPLDLLKGEPYSGWREQSFLAAYQWYAEPGTDLMAFAAQVDALLDATQEAFHADPTSFGANIDYKPVDLAAVS